MPQAPDAEGFVGLVEESTKMTINALWNAGRRHAARLALGAAAALAATAAFAVNDLPGGPKVNQLDMHEPVTRIAAEQHWLHYLMLGIFSLYMLDSVNGGLALGREELGGPGPPGAQAHDPDLQAAVHGRSRLDITGAHRVLRFDVTSP